jgi:putative ubiquitin-RnfH superfamily antitoxin RatB of RatAB toxin-antitoxin module
MRSSPLPISALPEVRELIDGAERTLKADISRIKRLLADPTATLPQSVAESTLQEARDALDLLAVHSRQLAYWQDHTISDAERAEVQRLRAIIPDIRPLIQRRIALAAELDKRAKTGTPSPRKKWQH